MIHPPFPYAIQTLVFCRMVWYCGVGTASKTVGGSRSLTPLREGKNHFDLFPLRWREGENHVCYICGTVSILYSNHIIDFPDSFNLLEQKEITAPGFQTWAVISITNLWGRAVYRQCPCFCVTAEPAILAVTSSLENCTKGAQHTSSALLLSQV